MHLFMYDGTYNRTCEAIALQVEHLQIDEVAKLLGQCSCKKVAMSANIQCMYDGAYNRTCQLVPPEDKLFQIDQLPKFDGNSSCDLKDKLNLDAFVRM